MAADVSARVHLVAEKLQQKAQDAQRKGNDNAARALASSVADLRQAMALISEQKHLLARRRGEGDDEEDDADAHVQELAMRLARVETMLGKKSEDMKAKGNENAATALQQSATTVENGRKLLLEQQQTIFGLLGRWEKLEDVVDRKRRSSIDEEEAESQLIARVRHLVQLEAMIGELFPECKEEEVKEEVERLRNELETVREEAMETKEMLKQESLALEEVKNEMERMKEREALRQEEDAALLEQQREACQAMEELVRESDQEIQRMTQSATAQAEEMQALRIKMESLALEKERLVRVHTDEVEELQGQLESAMDALSTKADEGEESSAEELKVLQTQLERLTVEKEELVKAHTNEMEEIRLQLENEKVSLSTKSEENVLSSNDELLSLRAEVDNLVSGKEDLVRLHTVEVEQLENTHTQEIEDLRQKLESAVNELSEQRAADDTEELQLLQSKVDSLTTEKEDLAKSHLDDIEELRKAHAEEIDDLRSQLKSATKSLSAQTEGSDTSSSGELQSLREEVHNLLSEKDHLEAVHADELETLRKAHLTEIEIIRHQLDSATTDLATETKEDAVTNADELQQLRADVGALTIEKDHLVKKHADEIEKLNRQVENARANAESISGDQYESNADEDEDNENGDSGDVPVIELEELLRADIAVEDEVDTSSNGGDTDLKEVSEMQTAFDDLRAQLAEYEERSQNQQDTISKLGHEQANLQAKIEMLTYAKAEAVDELQRTHEAEIRSLQEDLDALQTQLAEHEDLYQSQQHTIKSLENEKASHLERMEVLTNEKAQIVDELQCLHGEETTRLAQRYADSESTIESISAQLKEMTSTLVDKTTEQSRTSDALECCEAELRSCRSELDARIRECSQLKTDLEAIQNEEDVKSGEVDKRLSQLITELGEVIDALNSSGKVVAAEAMDGFAGKVWQSPLVNELCFSLSPLLTDMVSVQNQLHTTEEQLKLIRSESDNQKLVIDQFVKTADWRLFAKEEEEEDHVAEMLDSDKDLDEHLAVAKTNILCWLEALQQLRDRVEKNVAKINELEQEKLESQERLMTLEDVKRDLEATVESLNEKLATVQNEKEEMVKAAEMLKAKNHSASIQEKQQQVAQQEEVAELQHQLVSVRSEFERYRVRSHTALKKMEKRAELLNGMRKENEELLKKVKESDEQREHAEAARNESEGRLEEIQRTQEMMQADFDQFAMEKARVITELEEEAQRLESERGRTDAKVEELSLKIQELETEKKQIEEESERIKEAEQTAFQARLNTATVAVQTAKQDLQKVHDALEASKAENEKRQRLIEALELKLEEHHKTSTADTTNTPPTPAAYMPSLVLPSTEVNRNVAGLEKELGAVRASETALRKQLDDARSELIALQERFATTKAANAEKVFALEEQSNHWKMELAIATEELTEEVCELKTELADANTEIILLTRALDASREELQRGRDQIDALAPSLSEPESGEESTGVAKTSTLLLAKDEALKKLRVQVLGLQEELQAVREEKAALELEIEKTELNNLQTNRKNMQSEKERALQLQRRQTLSSNFEKQVATIVVELQQRLEEHSNAFREVCGFRDDHHVSLFADGDGSDSITKVGGHVGEPEFEEYLVMRSGVVIKAGASFQLPVICEKSGWRVVWNFSVKEDAADVSFKLSAMVADATSTETEVVSPERMNEMSGVFQVRHDSTTLVFEWDNSFSWLNEKTLDYHVSIQEPLTPQAQVVRRGERELQTKAKLLEDGLALIGEEAKRRSELSATLKRLGECEAAKEKHLAELGSRKTEVFEQKTHFQEEMDVQKAAFSAMLREQDELEDVERSITRAWEAAVAEREDVEMTLQLAGNGSQLETLAQEMEEQAKVVAEQLKNPKPIEERISKGGVGNVEQGHSENKDDDGSTQHCEEADDPEDKVEQEQDQSNEKQSSDVAEVME
ncbi:Myosin-like protein [Phytophthora palmivora]|uniref:Myosin-like protein n=1 Tax=Phytophthora palmivora TaxID=4796 RepID=A0A2P4XU74_9STRA|nr:Myosin-like protein [Phytophthora palmivora]